MKNTIILGPQGSGKGTQAKILAKKYNIPHISSGDIFRDQIAKETEIGLKAKDLVNQGKLVPDEIVISMVKARIEEDDCSDGYILDGTPRNLEQAKALDEFTEINYVIELDVDDEISVKRIVNRRQCRQCGAIYGLDIPPKQEGVCDKCGGELYQRKDDKEEAIRNRLKIYHEETEALLEYYKPREIVFRIDGSLPIDQVTQKIEQILG